MLPVLGARQLEQVVEDVVPPFPGCDPVVQGLERAHLQQARQGEHLQHRRVGGVAADDRGIKVVVIAVPRHVHGVDGNAGVLGLELGDQVRHRIFRIVEVIPEPHRAVGTGQTRHQPGHKRQGADRRLHVLSSPEAKSCVAGGGVPVMSRKVRPARRKASRDCGSHRLICMKPWMTPVSGRSGQGGQARAAGRQAVRCPRKAGRSRRRSDKAAASPPASRRTASRRMSSPSRTCATGPMTAPAPAAISSAEPRRVRWIRPFGNMRRGRRW